MKSSPSNPTSASSEQVIVWVVAGLLVVGAVALYLPSTSHEFINLDDFQYIIDNAYILVPSWGKFWAFFTEIWHPSTVGGYYQPLTMASLMIDRLIDGASKPLPEPFVFHLTNVILHALNVALVFWFIRPLIGSTPAAAVAAALFAVHPLNVEAVAWVCQRKALLSTFFALWMFLAYDRYARGNNPRWLWITGASLILSLMSKPTTVALPIVLVLLDVWPYRRFSLRTVTEKTPLYVIVGFFSIVAYVSQGRTSGLTYPAVLDQPVKTLLVVCHNIMFYLVKLVWPATLCPQYPMPPFEDIRFDHWRFGGAAAGVMLLTALLIVLRRHRPIWVCALSFVLLLGPVLGTVHFMGAIAADRFAYLPMIVLLLLLAAGLARLHAARRLAPVLVLPVAALAVVSLSWRTWNQQAVWANSLTYWNEVVRQYPDEAGAREGLGSAYLVYDDLEAALPEFHRAIELRETFTRAYFRIGEVLLYQQRPREALEWIQRGLDQPDADIEGWFLLGWAYSTLGEYDKAIDPYLRAIEIRPSWREALLNVANALLRTGNHAAALRYYARHHDLDPDNFRGLMNWALALTETGYDDRALPLLRRSLQLEPGDPIALYAFAACLAATGEQESAWPVLKAALTLRTDFYERAVTEHRFEKMRSDPRWAELPKPSPTTQTEP